MTNLAGVKVLFLGTYPPPFGGIASHLHSLLPYLVKLNTKELYVLNFDQNNEIEKHDGFIVYRRNLIKNLWKTVRPTNAYLSVISMFTFMRNNASFKGAITETIKLIIINELVQSKSIDVICCYHSIKSLPMVILDKYWNKKRGIILTVFGEVYDSPKILNQNKKLINKLFEISSTIWASSRHCANSFKEIGIKRDIEALFLGVDLDQTKSSEQRIMFRAENKFDEKDVVFCFVGRMTREMGLDALLEIIPRVLKDQDKVKFIIVGASDDLTVEALELASKNKGKVLVFENLPFDKLPTIYSSSDILLAPSFNQRACMGLAIKEAMASSLPVIASKGGGISEAVVNAETGYLIPLNENGEIDLNKLRLKMYRLIEDSDKRIKFGKAGRKRAEMLFSVERTNKRVAEMIFTTKEMLNLTN